MNIKNMEIEKFIEELSSKSPTPGGGSSAALVSTIGISLNNMVFNLTLGKEKYKENEKLIKELIKEGIDLKNYLKNLIEEDIKSYKKVINAYKMTKNTEKEIKIRKENIQIALKEAVIVPFEIMKISLKAINLTELSLGKTNINAISDLGGASINLNAGAKSAWLNILINLKSITDENFIKKYKEEGEKILKDINTISNKIYMEILKLF